MGLKIQTQHFLQVGRFYDLADGSIWEPTLSSFFSYDEQSFFIVCFVDAFQLYLLHIGLTFAFTHYSQWCESLG